MKNHSQLTMFLIWIIMLIISPSSITQNLITNPSFNADVSAWSFSTPGTFIQNGAIDADNDMLSGSGELANSSPLAFGSSFAAQCIEGIIAGSDYDFGAMLRFDSSNTQTASGRANIVITFLDGAFCSGSNAGVSTTANDLSTNTDTWTQNEILGFTAPAGSVSVQVSLFTVKSEDTGVMTVNIDNVVFGLSGVLPVELMNFIVE